MVSWYHDEITTDTQSVKLLLLTYGRQWTNHLLRRISSRECERRLIVSGCSIHRGEDLKRVEGKRPPFDLTVSLIEAHFRLYTDGLDTISFTPVSAVGCYPRQTNIYQARKRVK